MKYPSPSMPVTRLTGRMRRRFRAVTGLIIAAGLFLATPVLPVAQAGEPARGLQLTAKSDTVDLVGLEQSFRDIARRVSPSVVAITASGEPAPGHANMRSAELSGAIVERMLQGGSRIVGTGFSVDNEGHILTNEHVVRDARQIYVTTDDGRTYPAMIVGSDPRSDLAVLKIPGRLPPVTFAEGLDPYRGQWTVALGNPVGLAGAGAMSMSVGVVSATGRELPKLSEREGRLYTNLIQTTAEVNPGNSGGPLFDLRGQVIGVVTAVVLPHKTTNGIGFAIPADATLKARLEQLKRGIPIVYGYLGVAVRDHAGAGVLITSVGDSAPAAGVLQIGDVLLRVDGHPVATESAFIRVIGVSPTDRPVTLVVQRDGRELSVSLRLTAHPDLVEGVNITNQRLFWSGVTLGTATSAPGGGVRVHDIRPGSLLAELGMRPNTIIQAVAGKPVHDLATMLEVLDQTPAELCQVTVAPETKTVVASGVE